MQVNHFKILKYPHKRLSTIYIFLKYRKLWFIMEVIWILGVCIRIGENERIHQFRE